MNKIQKALVSLTRSALSHQTAALKEPFTDKDYKKLYSLAKHNRVSALCLDGIRQLPESQQLGKQLLTRWESHVDAIEKLYRKKENAMQTLIGTFNEKEIACMVFKGFSISRLYPEPSHREFGDIDIYLYKDYAKGNMALTKKGIDVDTGHHRARCHIQDIPVEIHASFLHNINSSFEKELEITAQKVREENNVSPLYLPPLHNAAYIAHHASQNFFSNDYNIRLRTLCDWAAVLKGEGTEWQYRDMKRLLRHTRERNMADMLTRLCHQWYGNVSRNVLQQLTPFTYKTERLFVKAIFAKKYQNCNDMWKWVRNLCLHFKRLRFKPLRRRIKK